MQSDEVQPWLAGRDSPILHHLAVLVEHRKVDPRVSWVIAGAPDDVLGLENATILQDWMTIAYPNRAWNPFDTSSGEIPGLDPDERSTLGNKLRTGLPSQPGYR